MRVYSIMIGHEMKAMNTKALGAATVMMTAAFASPAQSDPCIFDAGGGYYLSERSECDATANAVSGGGRSIEALGESVIQQQLMFGGVGGFAGPTGRVRHTKHDGLVESATGHRLAASESDEASVFANASFDLPGTVFGGQVRISGLIGGNWLSQETSFSDSQIDAIVYGGSYLWSYGSLYAMTLVIGLSGEVDNRTYGDRYNYDIAGYVANSVVGYTFRMPENLSFDLRGSVGRYDVSGDSYVLAQFGGGRLGGAADAWNAALTGTLFTIVEIEGGGVIRPYVAATYKNVFDEDIELRGALTASLEQADDYGKVELGYDYVQGLMTLGAAAYTEFSADEHTFGARIAMSVKLQ